MILLGLQPLPRHIRFAEPEDFAVLEAIHSQAFPIGWSAHEIEALSVQSGVTIFVATRATWYSSRRPVGFVISRTAADEAEILTIAVTKRHRRAGVGRELMVRLLQHGLGDEVRHVFLEVDSTNQAALTLYDDLGFVAVGHRPRYYAIEASGRGDAITMSLKL